MNTEFKIYRTASYSEFINIVRGDVRRESIIRLQSARDLIKYIALQKKELRYIYGFILPRRIDERRIDTPAGWLIFRETVRTSSFRGMGTKERMLVTARIGDGIKDNHDVILNNIQRFMRVYPRYTLILRPVKYMTVTSEKIEFAKVDYVDVLNFCKEINLPNVQIEIDLDCLHQMQRVYTKLGILDNKLRMNIEDYLSIVGELAGSIRVTDSVEGNSLKRYLSILQKSGVSCPIIVDSSMSEMKINEVRSLLEDVIKETE